jgi:hypothetical protein
MAAKREIFRIERANMLSSFPEPASSQKPNSRLLHWILALSSADQARYSKSRARLVPISGKQEHKSEKLLRAEKSNRRE